MTLTDVLEEFFTRLVIKLKITSLGSQLDTIVERLTTTDARIERIDASLQSITQSLAELRQFLGIDPTASHLSPEDTTALDAISQLSETLKTQAEAVNTAPPPRSTP